MRQIKVLAVLFALLPGIAAAQQILPKNSVWGRLGVTPSGPAQAIPFATLFANAGIAAGPQSCSSHNWFNTLNTGGVLGCSQPSFADIAGTIVGTQLPAPGASSLGGVQSKDCSSGSGAVQKINTDGTVTCNVPAGGGTVTQVICGTGLSGGTITASGTCAVSPIYVNVSLTTSSVSVSGTAATKIPFNNVVANVGGFWNTTNHNFAPTVAGTYEVCATIHLTGTWLQSGVVLLDVSKNATTGTAGEWSTIAAPSGGNQTGGSPSLSGCTFVALNGSTDTVEADVTALTAAFSSPIMDNTSFHTFITIKYVGP